MINITQLLACIFTMPVFHIHVTHFTKKVSRADTLWTAQISEPSNRENSSP